LEFNLIHDDKNKKKKRKKEFREWSNKREKQGTKVIKEKKIMGDYGK
jgi:hypothetical protein